MRNRVLLPCRYHCHVVCPVFGLVQAGPPSGFQWALHLLTMPWKLLFAIIPPVVGFLGTAERRTVTCCFVLARCTGKDYCGGWLCFYFSLMFIGLVTALISDLAVGDQDALQWLHVQHIPVAEGLVGCVLDMPDFITAITLAHIQACDRLQVFANLH